MPQHGLLKASFVPERPQRELRDLTRHRAQVVAERSRVANRVHKTLEDANIKLGAVASDVLGVSARAMIQALVGGEQDPTKLADLAHRRLRSKIPQLQAALHGQVTEDHRFMLRTLMDHLKYLEGAIEKLNGRIEELTGPLEHEIRHLSQVPGLERRSVENILAEIGIDMGRLPTDAHLASWARSVRATGSRPANAQAAEPHRATAGCDPIPGDSPAVVFNQSDELQHEG